MHEQRRLIILQIYRDYVAGQFGREQLYREFRLRFRASGCDYSPNEYPAITQEIRNLHLAANANQGVEGFALPQEKLEQVIAQEISDLGM
jgi:hypothetical protein